MKTDHFGFVIVDEKDLIDSLYSGKISNFDNLFVDQTLADQFNNSKKINGDQFPNLASYIPPDIDLETFDKINQSRWFIPENYCPDLIDQVYNFCTTQEQKQRVELELELFYKHNMIDLLFYLKYLVDTMRSNNIVWGVGRGSSVASYVLYIIGVHKIDSLKYNLDINEFLK